MMKTLLKSNRTVRRQATCFADLQGVEPESIAQQDGVSSQLVSYRIKITMLWNLYQRKMAQAAG